MMKRQRELLGLLILFCGTFLGCHESIETDYRAPVFAVDTVLTGEQLGAPLLLRGVYDIVLNDSLVFAAGYTGDEWLHIYNRENGQLVRKCIRRGKGPAEMVLLSHLETTADGRLILWDAQTKQRMIHPIDSLLCGNLGCGVLGDDPDFPDGFGFTAVHHVAPDRWLYVGHNGWGNWPTARFRLASDNKPLIAYNHYPEDSASDRFWDVWRSATGEPKIAVSPDGTKMAHGLIYGCILETFDIQNDSIRPVAVRRFHRPYMTRDMGIRGTDDCWYGFAHLKATDKRIYGIYIGQKSTEAGNGPNSLVVFDWEGHPIARYQTDYCLTALAATPGATGSGETEIYAVGLDPRDAEWHLVRFRI